MSDETDKDGTAPPEGAGGEPVPPLDGVETLDATDDAVELPPGPVRSRPPPKPRSRPSSSGFAAVLPAAPAEGATPPASEGPRRPPSIRPMPMIQLGEARPRSEPPPAGAPRPASSPPPRAAGLEPSHAAFEPPTLPRSLEPETEPRDQEPAIPGPSDDEEPTTPRREQLEPPTLVLSQDETPLGPPVRAASTPPPAAPPTAPVQDLEVEVEVAAEPDELPVAASVAEAVPASDPAPLSVEAVESGAAPARRPPPPPPKRPKAEGAEPDAAAPEPAPARPPRTRYWWEELFGEDYTRGFPLPSAELVRRDVTFIEESLGVAKGAVVLDLACGAGQHAVELSSRGYGVVGLDLSVLQLAMAGELAQERGQKLNFLQADMREMSFEEVFDGVYCWNTSFGYFEEDRNAAVAARIFRALRPGGSLLLDVVNRDFVVQHQPSQVWFEGDGCVCMDDMSVDFITSRLRVKRTMILDDGRTKECSYSIRLYSLHELGRLLHDIGFRVAEASGQPAHPGVFFGATSPRVIILAQKP